MAKKRIAITEEFDSAVKETARILHEGGVAVFPTETVYGIGVASGDEKALMKLRHVKQRDPGKPFQLLVADIEMARKIGAVFSARSRNLAEEFWPGPLTLVVPDGAGSATLGIRVPDSPFTLALCQELGRPIISSSANPSGKSPPLNAAAADAFGNDVDVLIDAGPIVEGVPSTVAQCIDDELKILRQGALDEDTLRSAWLA